MNTDEQIRQAKRRGDVKALRKIRDGINEAIDEASAVDVVTEPEPIEEPAKPEAIAEDTPEEETEQQ